MKAQWRVGRAWSGVLLTMILASGAHAAEVRLAVGSLDGPVADAVVSLHGATPAVTRTATARMDQQHSAFVPGVERRSIGMHLDELVAAGRVLSSGGQFALA